MNQRETNGNAYFRLTEEEISLYRIEELRQLFDAIIEERKSMYLWLTNSRIVSLLMFIAYIFLIYAFTAPPGSYLLGILLLALTFYIVLPTGSLYVFFPTSFSEFSSIFARFLDDKEGYKKELGRLTSTQYFLLEKESEAFSLKIFVFKFYVVIWAFSMAYHLLNAANFLKGVM